MKFEAVTCGASVQKISALEKVGYSLGDLAANLIFQTLVTFLAFFYTDVSGIQPAAASKIIAAGGLVGVLVTPVFGILADRTNTRWGRFRPWILWTALPFGGAALLAFSVPRISERGREVYALITYIILLVVYVANNLPYSALSGVLTCSMADRNSLSSYRFVAVMCAQFLTQVLLLPLVLILGKGDQAEGFRDTMLIFSCAGVALFFITFLTTRERVGPGSSHRSSVAQDVRDLLGNRPWVVMLVVTVLIFISLALKGGMTVYYFRHYLSGPALAGFLTVMHLDSVIVGLNASLRALGVNQLAWPGDAPAAVFSVFNAWSIAMMMIGIALSKPLVHVFGKRNAFAGGLLLSAIFLWSFYMCPPDAVGAVFLCQLLHGVCYGITIPLLWAMVADVADYSEWKNNRRATAIIFSAMILGLKLGLTIGSTLVASILAYYGYAASARLQTHSAAHGIQLAMSLYASIPFIVATGCLFFYSINKRMELLLENELLERRQGLPQAP